MTLVAGSRLGPYEIVAPLGAGGMGEVFRGRDTRLGRDVAIKILPEGFAQNEQFRARFEREAKTISSLNHPNICTLFDVGHEDGTHFLVMELIEGESLADRLHKGPLPLDQLLRYGAQVADALHRAHKQGIVHRDLKPGNVMLTKTGAKLLDFGLARPASESAAVQGMTDLTQAKPLTQEGTILGTFQYMAPEQLEGQEADARTDIFALGALLYEMATGKPAFEGSSRTSLIAAIVSSHPAPISSVIPMAPPALDHFVRKCLEKDPDDRWQSAHDVASELRWLSEAGSQAGIPTTVTMRRKTREKLAWAIAAAAIALAFVTALAAWRALSRRETPRVMRFSAPNTTSARLRGKYGLIAVSPDGTEIVYAGSGGNTTRLFRRVIDQFEAKPIPGTEGAVEPFFSPDGKWIGFFAQHKMMKVALSGGSPITICTATAPRGADWLEDDTIAFCPFFYGGIERVPASGGSPVSVSTVDRKAGERSHRWPHALPGGRVILYSIGSGGSWDNAKVVAQRLDNGERKVIIDGGCDARYVSTGHLVYVRGTSLYAVPFDPEKLEVRGQPVEVATGIANHSAGGGEFAFSRTGLLVYFSPGAGRDEGGRIAMTNRRGETLKQALPPFPLADPRFSPDGNMIVGERVNEIWSFELTRGTSTRITSGPRATAPIWSPDGSRIFYGSERAGPWQIYSRAADGSDEERLISKADDAVLATAISADGRDLLLSLIRKETGNDIALMTTSDGRLRPLVQGEADEVSGIVSPDGKWVAYASDESGRNEVYVRSSSGAPGRWQISNDGGDNPRWVRQDEIIYQNNTKLMTAAVKTEPAISAEPPQLLLERNIANYDIARDGRILIVEGSDPSASPGQLNVVINWFEELKR